MAEKLSTNINHGEDWNFDDVEMTGEPETPKLDRAGSQKLGHHALNTLSETTEQSGLVNSEQLRQATFEDVNMDEVEELTRSYADKVEPQRMAEIFAAMRRNYETLSGQMVSYMTEILGLTDEPEIIYSPKEQMSSLNALGECTKRRGGDLIRINGERANQYNIGRQIETIAHECWHSYQHMISDIKEGTVQESRQGLYSYNFKNYVKPETDFETYQNQLVEREARCFASMVREKLQGIEPDGQELRRKSIDNVDMREVHRTVDERMQSFHKVDFLQAMGIKYVKELYGSTGKETIQQNIEPAMKYLLKVAGVEISTDVQMVESISNESFFRYDAYNGKMEISQDEISKESLRQVIVNMAFAAWRARQDYVVRYGEYSERGLLYAYNKDHMQYIDWKTKEGTSQLLIKEASDFSESVLYETLDGKIKGGGEWKKIKATIKKWWGGE